MERYRTALPPLDLLIFFEAAYRVGSFTGCAGELHVSQAAVSKRIRQLEEWIGEPLFARGGKRLVKTAAGEQLYQSASTALEFLRLGLGSLRESAAKPLAIAANTAVGMFWLTPLLHAFGLSDDACPISLTTSDNAKDLFGRENDLVVAYSSGAIPGWSTTRLLDEVLTPLAAPDAAKALRAGKSKAFSGLKPASGLPLLNYPRFAPDWVDWKVWFNALGLSGPGGWRMETKSTYSQTIGDAIRGRGIALGSLALLHADLAAGRLVRLSTDVLHSGRGYFLCHPGDASPSGDAQKLAGFLTATAREQTGIQRG